MRFLWVPHPWVPHEHREGLSSPFISRQNEGCSAMEEPHRQVGSPERLRGQHAAACGPTGARAALLVQVEQLAGVLGIAWGRLSNVSLATGCSSHGPPKTCVLLSEVGAMLQSAQREILRAADTLATMVGAPPCPGLAGGLVAIPGGRGTCTAGGVGCGQDHRVRGKAVWV